MTQERLWGFDNLIVQPGYTTTEWLPVLIPCNNRPKLNASGTNDKAGIGFQGAFEFNHRWRRPYCWVTMVSRMRERCQSWPWMVNLAGWVARCCVIKAGRGCVGYQSAPLLPSRLCPQYSNTPAIKRTLGSQHAVHSEVAQKETHHPLCPSQSLYFIWFYKSRAWKTLLNCAC